MASKKVSVLKFVGTVSLGLLTGTSYTLSSFMAPSLLELSSASTAARVLRSLASTASTHLTTLSIVSGSSFLLAFALSPAGYRHPYLIYTSVLCLGTRLTTDYVMPSIFGRPIPSSSASSQRRAALAEARMEKAAARRMEASYEVLGDAHSDEGNASLSGEEHFEEEINGEEVRSEVEFFVRDQFLQTVVSGLGLMTAVLGIWGDGAHMVLDRFYI
ncbi:hypothetical protein GGR50DRAFT_662035 [Xylaria sp. CBS 124048]|nr:hypothetical protein GGR50DRAFT_662035 [Xylaria sp. CBS 124048]